MTPAPYWNGAGWDDQSLERDARNIQEKTQPPDLRECGRCVALQSALDMVAERLGEERMRDAYGFHYEAVDGLVRELGEARAQHLRYLNDIADAIGPARNKLTTGEPARSDAVEIRELRRRAALLRWDVEGRDAES